MKSKPALLEVGDTALPWKAGGWPLYLAISNS